MALGNSLRQNSAQYNAKRDESGTWRILNAWHAELRDMNPDDDIPDSHPAVKVLTEGEFAALITEATAEGVLDGIGFGGVDEVEMERLQEENTELQERNFELMKQIEDLRKEEKSDPNEGTSEDYRIKMHAINSVIRVVALDSLDDLRS